MGGSGTETKQARETTRQRFFVGVSRKCDDDGAHDANDNETQTE